MISHVDRGALAMICTTWARYVEAEEFIEKASQNGKSGLFQMSPNGYPIQSPWLAVSNKAIDMYKSLLSEFGLSPAARVRITPQTQQISLPGMEPDGQNSSPTLSSFAK